MCARDASDSPNVGFVAERAGFDRAHALVLEYDDGLRRDERRSHGLLRNEAGRGLNRHGRDDRTRESTGHTARANISRESSTTARIDTADREDTRNARRAVRR